MQGILDWLSGKKTYITSLLFGVFNFGMAMGWWTLTNDVWLGINSLLAMFGFGFLRAGVGKKK